MKIVLVGASGYGAYYIRLFQLFGRDGATITAIVDPFAERSAHIGWITANHIPVYPDLAAYYIAEMTANLVIIVSPIQFHKAQISEAISHGSAVLCEKPVTVLVSEALELRELAAKASVPMGIGFQWSFAKPILDAKRDILAGRYGKPICLKSHVSWKRGDAYYDSSSWKGRLHDAHGNCIMDSIAMNATAHYLHNILFMLGDRLDTSAYPEQIEAALFRGREIESYDTCFLRGRVAGGAEMRYVVSHVGEENTDPKVEYIFEFGRITFDSNTDSLIRGELADGTTIAYGNPMTDEANFSKTEAMIRSALTGEPPICTVDTVLPHLRLCEAMIDTLPIIDFPADRLVREDDPPGIHVRGLCAAMNAFYEDGRLPDVPGFIGESMMLPAGIQG